MSATASFTVESPAGPKTVSLNYTRTGKGEPLLLLHGIGHHWQAWEPVLPLLAAEHDVIAVDLPGFGASPALPDGVPYELATVANVLEAFCRELRHRAAARGRQLAGRPLRPRTGPRQARAHGDRALARRLLHRGGAQVRVPHPAVDAGRCPAAAHHSGEAALPVRRRTLRPGRRHLRAPRAPFPQAAVAETLAMRNATGFAPTLAAGRAIKFTDDVAGLPVTIGWGDRDRLLLPRQGVRARRIVPGSRLVRLRGCGHVPMQDDPATVARVILDTTRSLDA